MLRLNLNSFSDTSWDIRCVIPSIQGRVAEIFIFMMHLSHIRSPADISLTSCVVEYQRCVTALSQLTPHAVNVSKVLCNMIKLRIRGVLIIFKDFIKALFGGTPDSRSVSELSNLFFCRPLASHTSQAALYRDLRGPHGYKKHPLWQMAADCLTFLKCRGWDVWIAESKCAVGLALRLGASLSVTVQFHFICYDGWSERRELDCISTLQEAGW